MMFFVAALLLLLAISFYEIGSMIYPLGIPLTWKIFFSVLLLAGAFKEVIFRWLGGGMSFAPLLPRWVMLTGAGMFSFVIIAIFLLIFKDAVWLLWKTARAAGLIKKPFPAGTASWWVIASALMLTIYGTWEAVRVPDVAKYDVILPGLAQEFDGTKIAVLVDLHASSLFQKDFIRGVVEKTNALSPDIVLMPGDFVDGSVKERRDDLEPLSGLKASLGVFGTSGNHEYYSGYGEWKKQLTEFGVKMLENEHVVLTSGDGKLAVAGVPDHQGANPGFGFAQSFEAPDVGKALKGIPPDVPVILMAHRPEAAEENAKAGAALQVSGHTHGGLMPIIEQIIARFNKGYVRGWYDVGTMKLYVSRGTYLWSGFPIRLMDPSEITMMVLHPADPSDGIDGSAK